MIHPIDKDQDPSTWSIIRRLLILSWQYRKHCALVVMLHGATLLFGLAALSLAGIGIDLIRSAADASAAPPNYWFGIEAPSSWTPFQTVIAIAIGVLIAGLAHAAIRYAAMVWQAQLIQGLIIELRSMVYHKLQRLSFRFYDTTESASIINRVAGDVQSVRLFVDGVLIEAIQLILWLGIYLVYMLNIHVKLTLACLATLPVLWFVAAHHARVIRPAHRRNRELVDGLVRVVSENLQGVQVVKGFAHEPLEIEKFQNASRAVRDQKHWIFRRISRFVPNVTFLTHVSEAVLLGYGGYLVIQNQLRLGEGLIVFAAILQQFSTRVSSIAMITNSIQRSLTGAARVFEVLDTPIEIHSPANPVNIATSTPAVAVKPKALRFDHVVFGYDDASPVLNDVSFEVQPGQCLAVLGPNGSGKSTLLSLIPRFYDPNAGQVLVDDVDVRKLDLDDLRRNIGTVFQENFLFSNTVAANIAFGQPEATREQIIRAATIAAAHDFIEQLPHGYDTIIGENGVDLSGGQRQRLAIARAVLLHPPILLLDDPTAAVDPQTEHEILEALDRAIAGRTTIIVAHRVSTLSRADRVIVLDNGRIVEEGTHDQLMANSGHYRKVVQLQAADRDSQRLLSIGQEAGQ